MLLFRGREPPDALQHSQSFHYSAHTLLHVSLQPLQDGVRGMMKEAGDGGDFARRTVNVGGGVKDGTDDSSFRVGQIDLLKGEIFGNGVGDDVGVGVQSVPENPDDVVPKTEKKVEDLKRKREGHIDDGDQVGLNVLFIAYHSIPFLLHVVSQLHSSPFSFSCLACAIGLSTVGFRIQARVSPIRFGRQLNRKKSRVSSNVKLKKKST